MVGICVYVEKGRPPTVSAPPTARLLTCPPTHTDTLAHSLADSFAVWCGGGGERPRYTCLLSLSLFHTLLVLVLIIFSKHTDLLR